MDDIDTVVRDTELATDPQPHQALLLSRVTDTFMTVATLAAASSVIYGGSVDGVIGTATVLFLVPSRSGSCWD